MPPKQQAELEGWGIAPPKTAEHGDPSEHLKPLKPYRWRLEGNKLIGDTELGEVVNYIPTDYICRGMDENGLPILTKVLL